MKPEIKITKDGSHTLFISEIDETYHSIHGAIQEAKHVFIEAGLHVVKDKNEIHVLEVGFGTGLNALLTYQYANAEKIDVKYTGIELHPLTVDMVQQLNYVDLIEGVDEEQFLSLHDCSWNEPHRLTSYFELIKQDIPVLEKEGEANFDLIYFDAFGPNAQGEMWEKTVFELMHQLLKEQGCLVTYCAKGVVKRTLKEVGFTVEAIPGPPGKREMTRAVK